MRILYSIQQVHFAANFVLENNNKISKSQSEIFEHITNNIRFYGNDNSIDTVSTLGYTIKFSKLYLDDIIVAEVLVDPSLGIETQMDGEFNEVG